jgi:hypothetical protein
MRRHLFALAALASIVAFGVALSPSGSWQRPAQPVASPAPAQPVAYAPDASGAFVLAVAKPGEPGEYDAADYGLSLGDCVYALQQMPAGADAFCERDRG